MERSSRVAAVFSQPPASAGGIPVDKTAECRRHDSFRAYGARDFRVFQFPRLKPGAKGIPPLRGWERLDKTGCFGHNPPHKQLMGSNDKKSAEILQGTLDLLILKTLTRGEMHGYEITEWIHSVSDEALSVEEGALYPALHRLELRGLLSSSWDVSINNRRAKYYRLTAAGRKRLREHTESWRRTSTAINRILEST